MNATSQQRISLIYTRLSSMIGQLATLMAAEGHPITVSAGIRTVEEQDAEFLKGRDAEGNIIDKHAIVTNARGGYSWHNFGLAVDCEPVEKDNTIDWNADHPHWKLMEKIGTSLGLTSGATWVRLVDAPHFQLTGRFPVGAPTDEVREIYKQGGLLAVWAAVDASIPQ